MAKKELLFFIVVFALACFIFNMALSYKAYAADIPTQSPSSTNRNGGLGDNVTDITQDAIETAQIIVNDGRKSAMSAIKDKWNELQVMMHGVGDKELQAINAMASGNIGNKGMSFKVYVSTSMSIPLLKSYGKMAKKYGADLVLHGLPEGSWSALSNLVHELNQQEQEDDHISLQIDDPAFDEYGITRVPSIVLVREENVFEDNKDQVAVFDKITVNIGIRRALEEFAEKGELQTEARAILSKAEGK